MQKVLLCQLIIFFSNTGEIFTRCSPPPTLTVCFVKLVRTKRRLPQSQRMHLLLQRCSGRVRPASAHSAHDTMLSDAKASRSQDLAPSHQKRACRTVTFVGAEAVARRLEFVVPARASSMSCVHQ